MEWNNWFTLCFLLGSPFVLAPLGWSIMRGWLGEDGWWPGMFLFVFGLFPLYLMAGITEDAPGLQDARDHTRQPESCESLPQQRAYLEARLWELRAERQSP